jgi:hypothetical protein
LGFQGITILAQVQDDRRLGSAVGGYLDGVLAGGGLAALAPGARAAGEAARPIAAGAPKILVTGLTIAIFAPRIKTERLETVGIAADSDFGSGQVGGAPAAVDALI